jgi:hypothetical protein
MRIRAFFRGETGPLQRIINAMRASHFLRLAAAAALLAAYPADALAYIDPGTGSMLLQSLLAAVAAALVFGRSIWHKVRSVLQRDRRKDTAEKS